MTQKFKKTSVFAALAITLIAWYSSQHYNIQTDQERSLRVSLSTSTRIPLVDQSCSGISRSSLNSSTVTKSSYIDSVNSSIGIDGVAFLRLMVGSNNKQATKMVEKNPQGYLIFVISFAVGLVLIIVLSPFLLCCCVCPTCCPNCCCCRKQEQVDFTNYEIKCPIVFASVCLIAALGCSAYFLIANYGKTDSIQKTMCAASITYDDALNGNYSNSGKYFVGVSSLPSLLGQLSGNLTNLDSNLSELYSNTSTTALNQAITQTQLTETDIKKIPNNDGTNGSGLTLTYSTPLDSATSSGSISSIFPTILGSYSSQNGYVWGLYQAVYAFQQLLNGLKTNATSIHDNVTTIQTALNTSSTQASTFLSSIQYQNDGTFASAVRNGADAGSKFKMVSLIYLIVIIVFTLLTTIVVICLCNKKNKNLRCLLYVVCFLLFLLTIIGFIIALLLSLILPLHAWSCNFTEDSLKSQVNLQTSFITITSASNLRYIGRCMPFGDGDLMTELGGTQISSNIDQINSVMSLVTNFSSATYLTPIKTVMNTALNVISQYALSRVGDITDSTSISKIKALQSCSSQTNCNSACTSDSWVPSNSLVSNAQNYTCSATNGNQGNITTCSSGVSSTANGCQGCMDSAQVLFYYMSLTTLTADLGLRYGATCTFNTKLNNVWTKYYKIKQAALGPTVGSSTSNSGVYPRATTANNDLTTLSSKVDALNTTFTNIRTGLDNIFHLIDPVSGLTASLNCKVLGQDTQNFQSQACGPLYDYLYITRLVIGIMSYLLAVSVCCMVCVTSRNYRRFQNLDQIYKPDDNNMEMQNGFHSGQKFTQNPNNIEPIYFNQISKYK